MLGFGPPRTLDEIFEGAVPIAMTRDTSSQTSASADTIGFLSLQTSRIGHGMEISRSCTCWPCQWQRRQEILPLSWLDRCRSCAYVSSRGATNWPGGTPQVGLSPMLITTPRSQHNPKGPRQQVLHDGFHMGDGVYLRKLHACTHCTHLSCRLIFTGKLAVGTGITGKKCS